MGHIKKDCKIFLMQKRKTHAICHFSPLFIVCHICHFDLLSWIYMKVWRVGSFLKNFQREGEGTVIPKS